MTYSAKRSCDCFRVGGLSEGTLSNTGINVGEKNLNTNSPVNIVTYLTYLDIHLEGRFMQGGFVKRPPITSYF